MIYESCCLFGFQRFRQLQSFLKQFLPLFKLKQLLILQFVLMEQEKLNNTHFIGSDTAYERRFKRDFGAPLEIRFLNFIFYRRLEQFDDILATLCAYFFHLSFVIPPLFISLGEHLILLFVFYRWWRQVLTFIVHMCGVNIENVGLWIELLLVLIVEYFGHFVFEFFNVNFFGYSLW